MKSLRNKGTSLLLGLAALGGIAAVGALTMQPKVANAAAITVYKSPNCGCCGGWVEHMKNEGFELNVVNTHALSDKKEELGVPHNLGSCHTAVAGEYVIEGHVPAQDVRRLLAEKPPVAGIAVPGMPAGSPGMPARNGYREAFNTVSFGNGSSAVFAQH